MGLYITSNPIRYWDPSGKIVTEWDRAVMGGIPGRIDQIQLWTDLWNETTDDMKWRRAKKVEEWRSSWRNDYEYTNGDGITRSTVTNNEIHFVTSSIKIGTGTLSVKVGYSYYNDGVKLLAEGRTMAYYSSEGMADNSAGIPKSYLIGTGTEAFIRVIIPFSSQVEVIGGGNLEIDIGIFAIVQFTGDTGGGTLTIDFKDV